MCLPFPPLHFPLIFFPPSVRPWGDASVHQVFRPTLVVGRTYSFCGVQCVHSCADPLPHAGGGSPRQLPICHQKHSSKFRSILSPPPPSSFFLPTLLLLLPCKHSDLLPAWSAASSVAPLQAVQSEYTERNFPPSHGCGILPSDATLHPPLHCTA